MRNLQLSQEFAIVVSMIIALESSLEEALNVNANSPSASWKAHADATICNQF
jgi:hypothetical protein